MYTPLHPNHIVNNEDYQDKINYIEITIPALSDVLICLWESISTRTTGSITDIITADGCVDLVVDVLDKAIFYSGMSKTNFNFISTFPEHYFGFRLRPGAFTALTGNDATVAMDNPVALDEIDTHFDTVKFFAMPPCEMKQFIINYLLQLAKNVRKSDYIQLFEYLNAKKFPTTEQLFADMSLSPRQIQRNFKKHYGLTPQMVISIIKFQHSLKILLEQPESKGHLVGNYYDQSHFINDFKKNIGLTPSEFIKFSKLRKVSL